MGRQRSAQGGTGGDPIGTKASRASTSRSPAVASARKEKAPAPQGIPQSVANRMARRIALATGLPTFMGMGVFVGSYLLVSQGRLDIPTGVTLVSSGALFLLGLVGLSYGVFSASWEEAPGSLLGFEQISLNLSRLRSNGRS
ncbi:PAM68 family protein [Cyanobium sp. ATX 6F1]|uniref:PAM68 family protein n=1 Tax=unclassified Cyanobium TaxID=2627006 RepID=UPI0020CCCF3B|nr:PAM68 family protein [Cyanobium sp. ATX 6F1]MCP9916190.1 PAM68 family protein [Cyanobium sp. ATX 6F1]